MTLLSEISSEPETKTIIFVETKRRVDEITRAVCRNGWRAVAIHGKFPIKKKTKKSHKFYRLYIWILLSGNKTQQERDYVLNSFRNGRQAILVATDVAARGLGKSFCGQCIGWSKTKKKNEQTIDQSLAYKVNIFWFR